MSIDQMLNNENALLIIRASDLQEFAGIIAKNVLSGQPVPVTISNQPEKPMSQNEAVQFLGKSRQTLIKWRRLGIIKSYRLGGRIYFKPSELLSALKKN